MKRKNLFFSILLCGLILSLGFFSFTVYAAPATVPYGMYGRNTSFIGNFIFPNGTITLDAGDHITMVLHTKYHEGTAGFIDVSLTLSSSMHAPPFDNLAITKKYQIDLNDSNNLTSIGITTPRLYFTEQGNYPITAEIENLTTGGVTTFRFTVVVKGDVSSSTPPAIDSSSSSSSTSSSPSSSSSSSSLSASSSTNGSSSDDDSSEPILPPDPVVPTPPDPPLPYRPENDPLWIDLAKRLSNVIFCLFPVYVDNPDANYLPAFVAEALIGKDIDLLINHLGHEYAVNGLLLAGSYAGVDIPFTELPLQDEPVSTPLPKMERQPETTRVKPSVVLPQSSLAVKDTVFEADTPAANIPAGQFMAQSIALPYRAVPALRKTKTIRPSTVLLADSLELQQFSSIVSPVHTSYSSQKWATIPVIVFTPLALTFVSRKSRSKRNSPFKTKLVIVKT